MNDKDKEAFRLWAGEEEGESLLYDGAAFHTWQSACEYMKDEIEHRDDLIYELEQNYLVEKENKQKLQAENKKLREALEQIAYHVGKFPIHESYCELSHIAREALKEIKE